MRKVSKIGAVLTTVVLSWGLCLTGCIELTDSNSSGENKEPVKNVPVELTTDNAEEVLGKNYKEKTSIKIPNGVKKINSKVFTGSATLKTITIPESVTYIVDGGSYSGPFELCTALQNIELPSNLIYLGACAFYGCSALESVSIPESIPSIQHKAFEGCISLKSINFPASIVSISSDMCYGCLSLTSVTIPEGIKEIGESAFENCKALRSITIPSSILKIDDYAFWDCTALGSVTIKAEIPPVLYGRGREFANNQPGRKIYVPADSVETYKTAAGWKNYADDIEAMQ